ncbi:MAG: hypothetical protein EB023_02240 [Flavobacteriia bacterium]|nr:hypothetical protein [Flavobacteriia bacterium]
MVDQLATLSEVIQYAKKAINNQDAEVIYYPAIKEDNLGNLIKMLSSKDGEEDELSQVRVQGTQMPETMAFWFEEVKKVENKMGIQMRMPYDLVIRF